MYTKYELLDIFRILCNIQQQQTVNGTRNFIFIIIIIIPMTETGNEDGIMDEL